MLIYEVDAIMVLEKMCQSPDQMPWTGCFRPAGGRVPPIEIVIPRTSIHANIYAIFLASQLSEK